MPDLIIDGIPVSAPDGMNVLEAAQSVGIMIPRLCWHPALGRAGSCRMCAVMFTQGPVKGLHMSCMTTVREAMVVDTGHPEAMAFRKQMAELLMLHHPHDCPVCDEGGHCQLQEVTIACGHSLRSFTGKKRTYRNQDLGPLVSQEMNRCIHCYRCARYYQEFAGGEDFGPVRIAGGVQYGRMADGPLESPFAGNLTEVCPTGVFTDKPSRHKARYWDLERAPSVCLSCSLGCNTTVSARYREVIRIEARQSEAVNGHFICDRGRHGYEYANLADRPRTAWIGNREASMAQALEETSRRLAGIAARHGPGAVACLGSSRQSLESQAALCVLAKTRGWRAPEYSTGGHRKKSIHAAMAALDKSLHVSLRDIESADCILAVGIAPLSEAPMLALAMRQAARKGAGVAVIDPRPVGFPLAFTHIPARRRDLETALGAMLHRGVPDRDRSGLTAQALAFLEALSPEMPGSVRASGWEAFAQALAASKRPVIVCGTDITPASTPALAAAAAHLLAGIKDRAGFFPVLAGANAFGAALMDAGPQTSFEDILTGIENGDIRALVCVESDPAARYASQPRVQQALLKLDLLVVADYLPTATRWQAHIFLPSQTVFEAGGSFVNQEGRLQYAAPAMACGTPLAQTLFGGHPPRTYAQTAPGSAPLPSWDILARLGGAQAPGAHPWQAVTQAVPGLEGLACGSWPFDGVTVLPEASRTGVFAARPSAPGPDKGADLIITEQAFGTEELSSYGTILKSLAPSPQIILHPLDADAIKLRDEDSVHLSCPVSQASHYVRLEEDMARATVVMPRRSDSGWRYTVAHQGTVELAILAKLPGADGEEQS